MTRGSALISVLALFVAGVSIGALGMHLYDERRAPRFRPDRFDGPPPHAFALRIEERLGLTDEQRERLAQIREESRQQAEAIRAEMRPRIEQQMQETREKIYDMLTPEQRRQLDELRGDHPRHMDRFLLGHGSRRHERRHRRPPPP